MSSAFGGLNTVVRGLAAQQASLDTVGHNVANANTAGFSRQSVNLVTSRPQTIYNGNTTSQLGTGVSIESITRARDTFVDRQMWKETSSQGYGQSTSDSLSQIEGIFNESADTGIQTVLNQFWSSLQSLGTNAADNGVRTAVRQRGVEVVNAISHASQQLTDMVSDTNSVIDIKVDSVNQMTSEISSLNKQIVNIETGGTDHANDLRDRRDLLVDQMSSLINVNVAEDKYGNYSIQSNGVSLVDSSGFTKLTTQTSIDPQYGYAVKNVMVEGATQSLQIQNGELKGLIDGRDSTDFGVKSYLNKLSAVSQFMLQDFNKVQRTGFGTDNSSGTNFFGNRTDALGKDIDYNTWTPASSSMGWISELTVNSKLFDPTSGLNKIAAKTALNNLTVQQTNAMGGAATVVNSYTGATPQKYVVRINAITTPAIGDVSTIDYSTDNGTSWNTVNVTAGAPPSFTLLNSPTLGSVTISLANMPGNAIGDKYTFSTNQGNAAGDNAILLANKLKVDSSSTLGGSSLDTYYSSMIGALGVQSQDAKRLTDNQTTLVGQIENWRQSVAGVNMDEEMANMIKFQKGYNAAGRVITSMDEMLDKLINSTGIVGR